MQIHMYNVHVSAVDQITVNIITRYGSVKSLNLCLTAILCSSDSVDSIGKDFGTCNPFGEVAAVENKFQTPFLDFFNFL